MFCQTKNGMPRFGFTGDLRNVDSGYKTDQWQVLKGSRRFHNVKLIRIYSLLISIELVQLCWLLGGKSGPLVINGCQGTLDRLLIKSVCNDVHNRAKCSYFFLFVFRASEVFPHKNWGRNYNKMLSPQSKRTLAHYVNRGGVSLHQESVNLYTATGLYKQTVVLESYPMSKQIAAQAWFDR